MAEKVAKTGVERNDKSYIYFIKDGAVWCVPRKQPGTPKGKREKVVDAGIEMKGTIVWQTLPFVHPNAATRHNASKFRSGCPIRL